MKEFRTEYRITGRFRGVDKRHVVDSNRKWTKEDAEHRLKEIERHAKWEMEHKRCKAVTIGVIGISTEYHSDFDLLELRLESREVTNWEEIE